MMDEVQESDLHAYFDGELSETRRAEVESWLQSHPEAQEMLSDWARQADELQASFPLGDGLSLSRAEPRSMGWQTMAAMVTVAVLGVGSGWALRGTVQPMATAQPVQMAMDAHLTFVSEVIHPVEVQVAEEGHLLKWLSGRLNSEIQAPDLASAGFALLGGRLLPNMGRNAAQFMYENGSGARVTLYVTPTPDATEVAFQFLELNGLEAFYWVDKDMSYALVGQITKDSLRGLAIEVYEQLI
ncbi:MAG: anti-sigma factor [Rhodobacteraceae bacterium]|nr:anti-sigma factor [Paracoccaceae bacterium]